MFNKDKFLEKYQKVPVIEYRNSTCDNPLVSVCVQTYNQEKYIKQCLDGIVMQNTNFEFEILVGEDASKDETRNICIEYANKYSDKIKLFQHSRKNNIAIDGIPTGKFNFEYNIFNAKGKYIAICEGDDYWTDSLKLQKQVDFLENNEDFGLIYSDIDLISGNETNEINSLELLEKRYSRIRKLCKSGFIFWELLEKNLINTLTVCARKELILDYLINFSEDKYSYDHRVWLHIASTSKIKYVNEKWAKYRVLNQGISRVDGFFDRRVPLVKQSALLHYLTLNGNRIKYINKRIFSKVAYNIINDINISNQEKRPMFNFFKKHPQLIFYVIVWKMRKLLTKIKN